MEKHCKIACQLVDDRHSVKNEKFLWYEHQITLVRILVDEKAKLQSVSFSWTNLKNSYKIVNRSYAQNQYLIFNSPHEHKLFDFHEK